MYEFSRSLYFLIGQILIFQEALSSPRTPTIFQETISSPRTHTIFQETPMPRTHRHFPGRYPLSNRYFVNRSRWLLSTFFIKMEHVLASLEGSNFKNFPCPSAPTMVEASLDTILKLNSVKLAPPLFIARRGACHYQ